jgi:hypothetical protein
MRVAARQFSGLLPHRFGLPSIKIKCEVKEITFFFVRQEKIWQARSDLN